MTTPSDDRSDADALALRLPERGTGIRSARRSGAATATPGAAAVDAAAAAAAAAGAVGPPPTTRQPAQDAAAAPERRRQRVAAPVPEAGGARPSRRWMAGFVVALTVATVAGATLAAVGIRTLRDSNAGRLVTSTDPSEPGFEGLLEPTPTLLVAQVSNGELRSAAVLALAIGDAGGSVMLLPPSVEVGDGDNAATLAVTYAFGGSVEVLRGAGEAIAGVGIEDVVVLDDRRWAELVAPVAPLHIENPDELDGFPAGPVELAAADVAAWLTAAREGESELSSLFRQQLFWEAWIAAVAASGDPSAVPGELDAGVGRFVRGLAAGHLEVATIPVTERTSDGGPPIFEVDREALRSIITEMVPFPAGTALAPRTRVRLLDGTGDQEHVERVAPNVVAADAAIVVVGNADAFDYQTTEVRYHQPGQRAAAERLQRALGAGRVVEDVRPIDAFDVTIVLGTDT